MSIDLFSLEEKTALVTGAGRGIGAAIAKGFARAGASVACAARTQIQIDEIVAEIASAGGTAIAVRLDMADIDSLRAGVEKVQSELGAIDILVNNAGMNFREPFESVSESHYDEIMAVNLKGLFFLTQLVVPQMRERGAGKIINVGSLATAMGIDNLSVYASTKGAVGQLTKVMALEFGPYNVQANTICPGFIRTPLSEKVWADPGMQEWAKRCIPQGGVAEPEALVGPAIYLASAASDYMTGQEVYIDGGFSECQTWPIPEVAKA